MTQLCPKITLVCSGSYRVKNLPGNQIEIELYDVETPSELPGDTLYDKAGVAQRLGTSVRSIENWMNQKKNPLPFIRSCGRPKFKESDVQWWLAQGSSVASRRAVGRVSGVISK